MPQSIASSAASTPIPTVRCFQMRFFGQQPLVLVDRGGEDRQELSAACPASPDRQVVGQPADAHAVERQPRAAVLLEEVEDLLALAEAVEERRHGADVDGVGGEPEQVRRDPLQLREHDPDELGPPGSAR